MDTIKPRELKNIIEDGEEEDFLVVDVRTRREYEMSHIKDAVNIPLSEIEDRRDDLKKYDKVYINCSSGGRSGKACKKLGLENLVNVTGGFNKWESEGFPTE